MSLRDVIGEIADDMEKWADGDDIPQTITNEIRSYAKQLRRALKASEGEVQQQTQSSPFLVPQVQHDHFIAKAREEFRKQKGEGQGGIHPAMDRKAEFEEAQDGIMVQTSNGPVDGDWVSVDPQMPVGAKRVLAGGVYVLKQEGKQTFLEYSEEETLKLKQD